MLIESKPCAECAALFTPRRPSQTCCSVRCARKAMGHANAGKRPEAAIAAVKVKRARERHARLGQAFGLLTRREHAIYEFTWLLAYNVGYAKAYNQRRVSTRDAIAPERA